MRHKTKFGQLDQGLQARGQHYALQLEKLAREVTAMRVADALEDQPRALGWDDDLQFSQITRDRWSRALARQAGKPAFDFNKIKIVPSLAEKSLSAWQRELMNEILSVPSTYAQASNISGTSIKLLAEQRALEKRQSQEFLDMLTAMRVAEALDPQPVPNPDDRLDALAASHFRYHFAQSMKAIQPDAGVVHTSYV